MVDKHINDELKDTRKVDDQVIQSYTKLENFVEISSSKRIYVYEYAKEGIPFYRGQEISNINSLNPDELVYISNERYLEIKNKFGVPNPGDLLITAVGTIGNTWIVDDRDFYFKDGNILWIKPKVDNINMKYIELVIRINKNKIIDNSSGSSQNAITTSVLKNLKIYLPTPEEQARIVNFFSLIDDLIDKSTQVEQLHTLKKNILLKIIFNEDNNMNWNTKKIKLGDCVEFLNGLKGMSSKNFESDTPNAKYIQFKNIHTSSINESELGDVYVDDVTKQSRILKNDLLITGSSENFEEVGTTNINKLDLDNLFVNSFSYIMRTTDIEPLYLHYLLKAPTSRRKIILQGQGITRINLAQSRVANIVINVHDDELQHKIGKLFSSIDELILFEKEQQELYKQIKKYHLNNIFK